MPTLASSLQGAILNLLDSSVGTSPSLSPRLLGYSGPRPDSPDMAADPESLLFDFPSANASVWGGQFSVDASGTATASGTLGWLRLLTETGAPFMDFSSREFGPGAYEVTEGNAMSLSARIAVV